jgi:hypothetical protein
MTIGKRHLTTKYERWRIREPSDFKYGTFRTQDIGKKGFSKRVAGMLKSTGEWDTQAILIDHNEPESMKKTLRKGVRDLLNKNKTVKVKSFMRKGTKVRPHYRRGVKR